MSRPTVDEVLERAERYEQQSLVDHTAIMGWAEDRQVLADEVRRLRFLDGVDDRIRDVMDAFYDAEHTCGGDPDHSFECVACLYIELNKALTPERNA
jgi:hypothetical protein